MAKHTSGMARSLRCTGCKARKHDEKLMALLIFGEVDKVECNSWRGRNGSVLHLHSTSPSTCCRRPCNSSGSSGCSGWCPMASRPEAQAGQAWSWEGMGAESPNTYSERLGTA
eukprot:5145458-Amphidinium_carterae.2